MCATVCWHVEFKWQQCWLWCAAVQGAWLLVQESGAGGNALSASSRQLSAVPTGAGRGVILKCGGSSTTIPKGVHSFECEKL